MELDTVNKLRYSVYRLVGTDAGDTALTEHGESTGDVVDLFLTEGSRNAQRWMLKMGYGGWRKRSTSALTWTGTDAADGGQKATVPTDFLRAYGNQRQSALREADGKRWGLEINPEEDHLRGDLYYFRGEELWLGLGASPPTTLYLDYHYTHPKFDSLADNAIDFPMEARRLIVCEAANVAKEDNWLPGDEDMERKIERALMRAREAARDIARATKQPRQFRKPRIIGSRW